MLLVMLLLLPILGDVRRLGMRELGREVLGVTLLVVVVVIEEVVTERAARAIGVCVVEVVDLGRLAPAVAILRVDDNCIVIVVGLGEEVANGLVKDGREKVGPVMRPPLRHQLELW